MKLLAFDTSTELLSVAVQSGDPAARPPLCHSGPGAAQASATLIPVIQALLSQAGLRAGELDAIVFGQGPGSFTGLRTACAVAQGLAFPGGVPVLAVETLMAVAQDAHSRRGGAQMVAVLDARMDEVYWAAYELQGGRWLRRGEIQLGRPESVHVPAGFVVAGNTRIVYGDRLPGGAPSVDAMPTSLALLQLAPALLAAGLAGPPAAALPLYIRDKVAQTTQERQALAQPKSA